MQSVLITNGGPHSASKWAEATASHIIDIASHVAGERREHAIKLQAAIIDVLEKHHTTVQHGERLKLQGTDGHARLAIPCHEHEHCSVDDVVEDICLAAKGTPWEADFQKSEMITGLAQLVASHFATSVHVERSWHADRHPDNEHCKAFRAQHNKGA